MMMIRRRMNTIQTPPMMSFIFIFSNQFCRFTFTVVFCNKKGGLKASRRQVKAGESPQVMAGDGNVDEVDSKENDNVNKDNMVKAD